MFGAYITSCSGKHMYAIVYYCMYYILYNIIRIKSALNLSAVPIIYTKAIKTDRGKYKSILQIGDTITYDTHKK